MDRFAHRVAIIGASGWIGSQLATALRAAGAEVIGIGRSAPASMPAGASLWQRWDALDLSACDAVVNLAGERIDQRWTQRKRSDFRHSRVDLTEQLVRHLASLSPEVRPKVLVNASAVGIYGDRGDDILEESSPPGSGFLADLCRDWEQAALAASQHGVHVNTARIGVVLGRGGPAFEKLRTVFRCGLGGRLGHGRQWMPWVHIEDLVGALQLLCTAAVPPGAVNLVAPEPVTNRDFTRAFAAACRRPALAPVPAPLLRIALGGFASALLASQRVKPTALTRSGWQFRYPNLPTALRQLLG